MSLTDVRNKSDLSDYTGELQAVTTARITDRASGSSAEEAATGRGPALPVTVPCSATGATTGADCGVSTTFDAVMPGSTPDGRSPIPQLGQLEVDDGGDDGAVAATDPNTLFERQGVFAP